MDLSKSSFPGLSFFSCALFRILLGLTALWSILFYHLPYSNIFYSNRGIQLDSYLQPGTWSQVALIASIILSISYLMGFYARISALLLYLSLWLISLSATYVDFGFQHYLRLLILWSIFIPVDSYYTVKKDPLKIPDFPVLIVLQISLLYLSAAMCKSGYAWASGQAVRMMVLDSMNGFQTQQWIVNNQVVYELFSYSTLIIEFLIAVFIWIARPAYRYMVIVMLLVLHGGISVVSDVGLYTHLSIAVSILLLPDQLWRYLGLISTEPVNKRPSKYWMAFLIIVSFFIVHKNLQTIAKKSVLINTAAGKKIHSFLAATDLPEPVPNTFLFQRWTMYSPNPPEEIGWVSIEYEKNSKWFDLFSEAPVENNAGFNSIKYPSRTEKYFLMYGRKYYKDPAAAQQLNAWFEFYVKKNSALSEHFRLVAYSKDAKVLLHDPKNNFVPVEKKVIRDISPAGE